MDQIDLFLTFFDQIEIPSIPTLQVFLDVCLQPYHTSPFITHRCFTPFNPTTSDFFDVFLQPYHTSPRSPSANQTTSDFFVVFLQPYHTSPLLVHRTRAAERIENGPKTKLERAESPPLTRNFSIFGHKINFPG